MNMKTNYIGQKIFMTNVTTRVILGCLFLAGGYYVDPKILAIAGLVIGMSSLTYMILISNPDTKYEDSGYVITREDVQKHVDDGTFDHCIRHAVVVVMNAYLSNKDLDVENSIRTVIKICRKDFADVLYLVNNQAEMRHYFELSSQPIRLITQKKAEMISAMLAYIVLEKRDQIISELATPNA